MKEIPFVKPDQITIAQEMEEAILALPKDLVICVGVIVKPTLLGEDPIYHVTVACPKFIDPSSCSLAVSMELKKRWKFHNINVHSFRGRVRDLTS